MASHKYIRKHILLNNFQHSSTLQPKFPFQIHHQKFHLLIQFKIPKTSSSRKWKRWPECDRSIMSVMFNLPRCHRAHFISVLIGLEVMTKVSHSWIIFDTRLSFFALMSILFACYHFRPQTHNTLSTSGIP